MFTHSTATYVKNSASHVLTLAQSHIGAQKIKEQRKKSGHPHASSFARSSFARSFARASGNSRHRKKKKNQLDKYITTLQLSWDHFGKCAVEELSCATQGSLWPVCCGRAKLRYSGITLASVLWKS